MLLSKFPAALHAAYVASPDSDWVQRLFPNRNSPSSDIYDDIVELQRDAEKSGERILPLPQEVTLSALAMSTSHMRPSLQPQSSSPTTKTLEAFDQLARLHLYFAKLDPLLVDALVAFPRLTHIRLTRPFSEHLSEAVFRLLGGEAGGSRLQSLIVEAGIYMDQRTSVRLRELQAGPLGRNKLHFIDNLMFQHGPYKPPEVEAASEGDDEIDSSSSSTHVINWVTSSEERGFTQFTHRAWGGEGVWSTTGD